MKHHASLHQKAGLEDRACHLLENSDIFQRFTDQMLKAIKATGVMDHVLTAAPMKKEHGGIRTTYGHPTYRQKLLQVC